MNGIYCNNDLWKFSVCFFPFPAVTSCFLVIWVPLMSCHFRKSWSSVWDMYRQVFPYESNNLITKNRKYFKRLLCCKNKFCTKLSTLLGVRKSILALSSNINNWFFLIVVSFNSYNYLILVEISGIINFFRETYSASRQSILRVHCIMCYLCRQSLLFYFRHTSCRFCYPNTGRPENLCILWPRQF